MIELQNIQKTYITKNKSEAKALKNVNLKLPNSGLCFLLGKSGCGKSTMLNIIGGIEKATSGDVIVEGKNLSLYSETEMDAFRANHIGFVFQDFNLIENMNVKDNLLISAELANKSINEQDIEKALEGIDLAGIERRYPKELSAGQQQRIAIARAMIKQPKVILADEPTGNLDSINGVEILKILKKLSKTHLIFIVTHDRQLANEFGDIIIEMKDGEITSINEKETVDLSNDIPKIKTSKKNSLSFKRVFVIALRGLRKKAAMISLAILICIVAISCSAFGQSVLKFEYNSYLVKTLENNEISLFSLNKRHSANVPDEPFTIDEFSEIKNISPNNIFYKKFNMGYFYAYEINDESAINEMGFSLFSPSVSLDLGGVYISDGTIARYLESGSQYPRVYKYKGTDFIKINSYDDFVGDIYLNAGSRKLFTVNGIVNTNYQYYKDNADKLTDKEKATRDNLVNTIWGYQTFTVFCNEETCKLARYDRLICGKTIVSYGENNIEFASSIKETFCISTNKIYKDGLVYRANEVSLSDKEIIISFDMYNAIYSTSYSMFQFINSLPSVLPTLGEEISLNVEINNGNTTYEFNNFMLAGIVLSDNVSYFIVSENNSVDFNNYIQSKANADSILGILEKPNELVTLLNVSSNIKISSAFSSELLTYDWTQKVNGVSWLLVGIVCMLIACFLIYLFVNTNILRQKKSIGILRSLGTRNKDVIKIYLIQGFLIALIIAIMSLWVSVLLILNGNSMLDSDVAKGAFLVDFNPYILLEVVFAPFIAVAVSLFLPIIKLFKMKPIDAIRKMV